MKLGIGAAKRALDGEYHLTSGQLLPRGLTREIIVSMLHGRRVMISRRRFRTFTLKAKYDVNAPSALRYGFSSASRLQ